MNGARLTLTATERLARELRERANLERSREGASVWEAPQVASLSRWLIDAWTASWPDSQLLSATQELVLWSQAVERDEAGRQLLAPLAAAREARRADQLVRRWRIQLDGAPAWQDEHHAFRRWRAQVQKRLDVQSWITAADIPAQVERRLRSGEIAAPESIRLEGFVEDPTPAERAVLDALVARGTQIERVQPGPFTAHIRRVRPADDLAGFRHAVHEIRERLRACMDHREPPPRIVIALPDPESQREPIEAVLRELLAPWAARGEGLLPWRWERGRSLAEQPWVACLLDILRLSPQDNPPGLISRVLLSAALWPASALRHTAAADYRLRRKGIPRVRLLAVADELNDPGLRARFRSLHALIAAAPSRGLPSDWAAQFRSRADTLGWPGTETLDSASFQAVRAARGLFDRLATLDGQLGRITAFAAREWLSELARASFFAPRVEHVQPVLVTSLDEAASLSCDALYVLDVAAAKVPASARPTPFLPLELMRAAGVPEATPEAWLARAQRVAQTLRTQCAEEVLVAVPKLDARGAELQPSALYGAVGDWSAVVVPASLSLLERTLESGVPLEWPEADAAPPVDAAERDALRADSGLFRAWFESPFFAFCRYRLGIEALPMPARGLDARVQGNLVHAVLEDFWGVVADSRGLAALDEPQLRALVETAVDRQLPRHLTPADYGAAIVRLERGRSLDLVRQWLAHERRRIDPFTVILREAEARPVIAELPLRLRLDRVDKVETPEGERWLVLDYKTGREAKAEGWRVDKFSEPQLPLYASHAVLDVAQVPRVDGICFAHLKDGHPAFVPRTNWRQRLIEKERCVFEERWDERLGEWRVALENAVREFLAGQAWLAADIKSHSNYAELLALGGATPEDE
ncbi:MAG: PD-(D/E)XK nuclease family protein [Panacagrimonas sp.]